MKYIVILPLSSSSFNAGQVLENRRALFQKMALNYHNVDSDLAPVTLTCIRKRTEYGYPANA